MAAQDRSSTGALTGVFAPGSQPLPETLRTLVLAPRRTVSPGEVIRAEFAFSNLGGAAATGVRVRFANPSGAAYVEGSDTVDEAPLADEVLVANTGASLGDLPPGAQRRVACSFRVGERIEDGSELLFQAALVTDQTAVVASNVERLSVRSEPQLQNTSTLVTIASKDRPKPDDVILVRATIANTGSSSAHDVLALLPVPQHTRYVARSARVAGRALIDSGDEPFDYASEHVVAARLAPGQSVHLEYQARIDSPLADGTRIKVSGAVSAREVGEFDVQSAEIVVSSPADFANDETALTIFCDDVVSPGTRVPISVRAVNAGTGDAQNVSIGIELPAGIAYTPGSAHLDGQPVSDETFAGGTFSLGAVPAGRAVDVGISGIVVLQHSQEQPITATLRWKGPAGETGRAERRFARTLRVRVSSRFTRARNYLEVDRSGVASREDVTFSARVFNDGTAPETDVRMRVIPSAFLENIRIAESVEEPAPYVEPFVLGVLQPQAQRTFTIQARVASPVPDRTQVALGAVLEFASGTFDLGVANVIVRSRPHVVAGACTWLCEQPEPLRPGQTHELTIRFTNDGSDMLRDARLDLLMPPELVLERAQNARRDGSALLFGDIAAETTHEARVGLRLARPPKRERSLTIEGTLSGRGISPVQFDPLEIATFAEPEFGRDAQLRSSPIESINAGERIAYEVQMRNSGDGPADSLIIRAVPSNLAVYVPGTTQLNGVTIPDDLGTSQLWSQRGLALTDVNPDVELRVRWEMLVISPIAAGTPIDTRVVLEWDGNHSAALTAPTLHVFSAPSLAAGTTGTPISVAQLLPVLETPARESIVAPVAPPAAQRVHEPPIIAEPELAEPELREPELREPEPAEPELAEPELAEPELAHESPVVAQPEKEEPEPELAQEPLVAEEPEREEPELAQEPPVVEEPEREEAELAQAPRVVEEPEIAEPEIAGEEQVFEGPEIVQMPPVFDEPLIAQPPAVATAMAPVPSEPPATPEAGQDAAHATLYYDYSPDQLARTIRTLERTDAGGLIAHIFAARALLPNALAGADPKTAQTMENAAIALRAPLDRFFVRLRMPRLAVTAKDLEDRESRSALRALVDAAIGAQPFAAEQRGSGVVRLLGALDPNVLRERMPELESAPLGSVLPWSINAQLLGTRIEYDGSADEPGSSEVLGMYRNELIDVFNVLETLPLPEFHRVLSSSVNRTLDDALGAVLDALRTAAHVVAG